MFEAHNSAHVFSQQIRLDRPPNHSNGIEHEEENARLFSQATLASQRPHSGIQHIPRSPRLATGLILRGLSGTRPMRAPPYFSLLRRNTAGWARHSISWNKPPIHIALTYVLGTTFTQERLCRNPIQQPHPESPPSKLGDPPSRLLPAVATPGSTVGGRRRLGHSAE